MMIKDVVNNFPDREENIIFNFIDEDKIIKEMEFYFPIKKINVKKIIDIFIDLKSPLNQEKLINAMRQFSFEPVKGFLKGFIDVVFNLNGKYYIVDWKSNYLGDKIEDYSDKNINEAMIEHHYLFQYYIYTAALHLYLSNRDANYSYEENFGGVYYVFVRGADTDFGNINY